MYQHPHEWVLGEVLQKSFQHPSPPKSIHLLYRYVTRDELVAAMERVSQGLREEIRSSFNSIGKLAIYAILVGFRSGKQPCLEIYSVHVEMHRSALEIQRFN